MAYFPLVSVIIPAFNAEKCISDTLNSILCQTYSNIEIVCIDDCSTDETISVINEYIKKNNNIRIVKLDINSKTAAARNAGIRIAKGDYILPLDADDLIAPNYISKAIDIFIDNPEIAVVYCKAKKFGFVNEDWILPPYNSKEILEQNMVHCSGFFRKEDWGKYNGYDEKMIFGREDWDFWLNFVEHNRFFYRIPEPLFFYRVDGPSRSAFLKDKVKVMTSTKQIYKNHRKLYKRSLKDKIIKKISNIKF